MTCESIQATMTEYLDGLLDGSEREEFELHLEDCGKCRQEAAELKSTLSWLKQAGDITPPVGLRAAVLSQLHQERHQFRSHRAGFSQAVAAAAVFLMLVAGNVYTVQPSLMKDAVQLRASEVAENYSSAPEADDAGVSIMEEMPVQPEEGTQEGENGKVAVSGEVKTENTTTVNNFTEQSRPFPLRLVLNLILAPLFLLLSGLALKKRKEATP
jgi:anti-sigma factor RsiW